MAINLKRKPEPEYDEGEDQLDQTPPPEREAKRSKVKVEPGTDGAEYNSSNCGSRNKFKPKLKPDLTPKPESMPKVKEAPGIWTKEKRARLVDYLLSESRTVVKLDKISDEVSGREE
jgi:hypothetical protein